MYDFEEMCPPLVELSVTFIQGIYRVLPLWGRNTNYFGGCYNCKGSGLPQDALSFDLLEGTCRCASELGGIHLVVHAAGITGFGVRDERYCSAHTLRFVFWFLQIFVRLSCYSRPTLVLLGLMLYFAYPLHSPALSVTTG